MLSIKELHVSVEDKAILRGLSLDVRPGEVHAIMGPNGSGKSTLSATLAGREDYEVTSGTVEFKGKDLLALSPEDRAGEGIFMAFQYPVEIPGVSNQFFLQTALNAVRSYRGQETLDRFDFQDLMEESRILLTDAVHLYLIYCSVYRLSASHILCGDNICFRHRFYLRRRCCTNWPDVNGGTFSLR